MKSDIVSLVGEVIFQSQQEKLERYTSCGCSSCQVRASGIDSWLNPSMAVPIPEPVNEQPHPGHVATVPARKAWLCHSCLRKAVAPNGKCPYCGTERYVAE